MFNRFNSLKSIKFDYAAELAELAEIEKEFSVVDAKRKEIEEENRKEAEALRQLELGRIRSIVAAKAIQRAWRQFRTRKLLKSKKKRRKKTASTS